MFPRPDAIRLCHTAAILSRETKTALFYHAEPRGQNRGGEATRGKTKLFWSPGTIWPPRDKGEYPEKDCHVELFNHSFAHVQFITTTLL